MAEIYNQKKAIRVGCIFLLVFSLMTGLAVYGAVRLVTDYLIPAIP